MGIDLGLRGSQKKHGRKECKSPNPYLRLLVQLYKFLARRAETYHNKYILKKLMAAKRWKHPIGLWKVSKFQTFYEHNTTVVVGSVTDDLRLIEVPKMSVAALRFSTSARNRILKAGGECLTLDQLALRSPTGKGCRILRAPQRARECEQYFQGAPGTPMNFAKARMFNKKEKSYGKGFPRMFSKKTL